jgi:CheY-like chemotaxis protein
LNSIGGPMSRILLADDSPHAQRMGERILREEGFEVVSLTDGNAAMSRLADVDPDLILADVFLPGKSGFELCRYVKNEPRFKHVRVVLTAGLLEPFDEDEAKRAGCDAIIKKPFEASRVVETIDPLVKEAQKARQQFAEQIATAPAPVAIQPEVPKPAEVPQAVDQPKPSAEPATPLAEPAAPAAEPAEPAIDPERVRAAVTIALDAALPAMIQEITERVLIALGH